MVLRKAISNNEQNHFISFRYHQRYLSLERKHNRGDLTTNTCSYVPNIR